MTANGSRMECARTTKRPTKRSGFHATLKSLKQGRDRVIAEIAEVQAKYSLLKSSDIEAFSDLPLSKKTLNGLNRCGYVKPTEIQREGILLALRGFDLVGAAKTGSGKTLAFSIPVIEYLWRQRWTAGFGLAAIVISPTRELALQTYETIRKVGCFHEFSAALIIGGTDAAVEKRRINRCNMIVCTPGRLLQHMDENFQFDCSQVKLIVLDEADRILDLGFADQLNSIFAHLPVERQTLLFSATQTRSVTDLARLSLKEPVYISVHEYSKFSTPDQLVQKYAIVAEEDKLNFLWSFLRSHTKSKILVFFNSCKQVRFVFNAFSKLKPGLTLLCLYGGMPLKKRVAVFEDCIRKQHAALLATDIAARGLDFPAVDWVLHLDCPSDVNEYIHRSGRTARYVNKGRSLLVIAPNQTALVTALQNAKVPITETKVNPEKLFSIQNKLQVMCTQNPELKDFAQKAIVAYIKSVFFMSNKELFDVYKINLQAVALSAGLVCAPRIRFLEKRRKVSPRSEGATRNDGPTTTFFDQQISDDDDGDDLLKVKCPNIFSGMETANPQEVEVPKRKKPLSRFQAARKLERNNIRVNTKIVFSNSDEEQHTEIRSHSMQEEEVSRLDIEEAKRRLQEADKIDRQVHREKLRAKQKAIRMKKKLKEAQARGKPLSKALLSQLGIRTEETDNETPNELDISWLPDYDKLNASKEEELAQSEQLPKRRKRDQRNEDKQIPSMTLSQKEQLALKILGE
uniref:ATP-dependent RNA helicase n=1 Tax=Trichuris muris TaxID=70415 RepID=A0A5S6Q9X8_TRIMR